MAHFLSIPPLCTVIGWIQGVCLLGGQLHCQSREAGGASYGTASSALPLTYLVGPMIHPEVCPSRESNSHIQVWYHEYREAPIFSSWDFPCLFLQLSECHRLQPGCTAPSGLATLPSSACKQLTLPSNDIPPPPPLPFMLFSKHTSHSNHHINSRGYHLTQCCWLRGLLQLKSSKQFSLTTVSRATRSWPLPTDHPSDI